MRLIVITSLLYKAFYNQQRNISRHSSNRYTSVLLGKLQACCNLPKPSTTQVQVCVLIDLEAATHKVKNHNGKQHCLLEHMLYFKDRQGKASMMCW